MFLSRFNNRYRPDSFFDRLNTPSRIYIMRVILFIVRSQLSLFSFIFISKTTLMTGYKAETSYNLILIISMIRLDLSIVVSVPLAAMTVYAGLVRKRCR